jgi:hypothetical protein
MDAPLPCDPDQILSYEPVDGQPDEIRVLFKDGSAEVFRGADAQRITAVLEHVTPPTA